MKLKMCLVPNIVVATLISQVAAVCFNKPDGTFVADPSDRQRFFWCQNGEGLPGKCDDGQVFENGYCEAFTDPCANKPDGYFVADPSNRKGFYWCSNGAGQQGHCPDGELFFEDEQACGFDETTTRPGPPGPPTRPPATTRLSTAPPTPQGPCTNMPDNSFVADPMNRRGYFWCQNGVAYPGECVEGEIFLEDEQYCDAEVTTTRRPIVPTRPPVKTTTLRPGPPTRPPVTTRKTTAKHPVIPTRGTTQRTSTRRPVPSRPPPVGK